MTDVVLVEWDTSQAPWVCSYAADTKQVGWGIESLAIDPFDSNHFMYGTGLTNYGEPSTAETCLIRRLLMHNVLDS